MYRLLYARQVLSGTAAVTFAFFAKTPWPLRCFSRSIVSNAWHSLQALLCSIVQWYCDAPEGCTIFNTSSSWGSSTSQDVRPGGCHISPCTFCCCGGFATSDFSRSVCIWSAQTQKSRSAACQGASHSASRAALDGSHMRTAFVPCPEAEYSFYQGVVGVHVTLHLTPFSDISVQEQGTTFGPIAAQQAILTCDDDRQMLLQVALLCSITA